uniref:1-alkyl-2-acetylglycerophosphocholine esterase n=1 Tax=Heterorhabditis bacteriophora TaxID=37862 RepID=A0A1I7XGK4_HETBA
MGLSWSCSDRSHILPRPGSGTFRVGCADLMLNDGLDGDSGIFMRIFYPVDQDDSESQPLDGDHPLWLPRKEYLEGLASYLKQSSRRLQLFFDWIIGEKRYKIN